MAIRKQLWHKPKLRTDEEFDQHRAVTWLELYFDLVFVVVIARLAHGLLADVTVHGLVEFLLMFLGVWWIWNAMTYYIERFESEGLENRVFTFLTMLPVASLAIHAHHGLGDNYVGFAASYLLARAINMSMWIRAGAHEAVFRPVAARFVTGYGITAVIIVASMFLPESLRLPLWGVAILVDILSPNLTIKHQAALPKLSTSKFPERMGLVTIVVLGEVVAGVINGLSETGYHLDRSGIVNGILGLSVGFSLWWVYFDYVARRPPKYRFIVALGWNYLHLALNIAITVSGVGIALVLRDAETAERILGSSQLLILAAVGASLLLVALLELTLQRKDDEPFGAVFSPALKGVGGLALLAASALLPALDATVLLLLVMAALLPQIIYGARIWLQQEAREQES
jgi:low temperature requirement protein LtrA